MSAALDTSQNYVPTALIQRTRIWVRKLSIKFASRKQRIVAFASIEKSISISLSSNDADRGLLRYLQQRVYCLPLRLGATVLALPDQPGDYCRGRPRQALRTNRSRANAMGMQVRRLLPGELRSLAERALTSEHVLVHLNIVMHEPNQPYMEDWVGTTSDGEPIAFARFAVGTTCAFIKYFAASQDHDLSVIRWKMAADTFESLAARGIRYIVADSVLRSSKGLAYYQDRLGFVPCRIKIHRAAEKPAR